MIKILHLIGTWPDGGAYEALVIEPDLSENKPTDYVPHPVTLTTEQIIELEGDWPASPADTYFERAY